MKDKQGRKYAFLSELKSGDKVQVDGDFDCMTANSIKEVRQNEHGLYIECAKGEHYLDGQLPHNGDDDWLMGIYPA